MDKFNLDDLLSRPQVKPNNTPTFTLDENEPIEDANVVFDDEVLNQDRQQQEQQAAEQAQVIDPVDLGFMPPKDIAEILVNAIDGLQSSFLPILLERKIFTEKEREVLQIIDTTGAKEYPENSTEAKVLAKLKYYKEKVGLVPFNKGETRRLVNATERYAKTVDLKMTPLQGLIAAFSEVVLIRGSLIMTS